MCFIVEPFMCPVCYAEGENADSECEANIVNKPCFKRDPVCALAASSAEKYRERDCFSRENYEEFKNDCEVFYHCNMTMCNTTGCKAEFPASGILLYLQTIHCSLKN